MRGIVVREEPDWQLTGPLPLAAGVSRLYSLREHCGGACMLFVGCVPFFANQVLLKEPASEVRFVFSVGHGVRASGLQVRRFLRTSEPVEKVAKSHFPALGGHPGTTARSVPAVF